MSGVNGWAAPERSPEALTVAWLGYVYALGNLCLGFALLFGSHERLSALSFQNITGLMPDRAWGVGFVLTGVGALYGQVRERRRPARLGHWCAAAMCLWWVISFALVVPGNVKLSWTPLVAYGVMCAGHAILGKAAGIKPER
jgi:hypothetical protein